MVFKNRKTAFHSTENDIFNIKAEQYSDALEVENRGILTKLQGNFHNRFTSNADLITISCHELYLSYTASLDMTLHLMFLRAIF